MPPSLDPNFAILVCNVTDFTFDPNESLGFSWNLNISFGSGFHSICAPYRPSEIGWRPFPLPGPECSCTFLTLAFILQTYHESHWAVLLINYSDSDSDILGFNITPPKIYGFSNYMKRNNLGFNHNTHTPLPPSQYQLVATAKPFKIVVWL